MWTSPVVRLRFTRDQVGLVREYLGADGAVVKTLGLSLADGRLSIDYAATDNEATVEMSYHQALALRSRVWRRVEKAASLPDYDMSELRLRVSASSESIDGAVVATTVVRDDEFRLGLQQHDRLAHESGYIELSFFDFDYYLDVLEQIAPDGAGPYPLAEFVSWAGNQDGGVDRLSYLQRFLDARNAFASAREGAVTLPVATSRIIVMGRGVGAAEYGTQFVYQRGPWSSRAARRMRYSCPQIAPDEVLVLTMRETKGGTLTGRGTVADLFSLVSRDPYLLGYELMLGDSHD